MVYTARLRESVFAGFQILKNVVRMSKQSLKLHSDSRTTKTLLQGEEREVFKMHVYKMMQQWSRQCISLHMESLSVFNYLFF